MSSTSNDLSSGSSGAVVRSLVSWVVLAGLIVVGVLLWNNKTYVADEFRLLNYTPSADVSALAGRIGFTNEGQRYFYASHPAIEDKSAFNASCGGIELHSTVLGCYVNYSIYVYNVSDPRLDGVQEVTAAHEMLHAAYIRLTDGERDDVDAMLQRQYEALADDAIFIERFAVYDSLSQADKLNELHSILGTEIETLSDELETYYQQYLAKRSAVISFYTSYQGQFEALRNQQVALKAQINTLKSEIDSAQVQYSSDRASLDKDIQSFNQRAEGGGYSSQSQFSNDRAMLVQRSNVLNQEVQSINTLIGQYNDAIKQYNELSIQTQDLQNSLDSKSVESAPTI